MTGRAGHRDDPAIGLARQSVTDSVVLGDVIQIRDIEGNVSVRLSRPVYGVTDFPVIQGTLTVEQARVQPSRLLMARYEAVSFGGRTGLMTELSAWLRETAPASVRLIHGPGGQGKSRLAIELCRRHSASWAVWQARQVSPASRDPTPIQIPADVAGVLLVVDYADRWALSHLQALIADVYTLARRLPGTMPLRVLLLARVAGFWWDALEQWLDADYGISATAEVLSPLGGEVSRDELFMVARDHFAVALGVTGMEWAGSAVPPAGLEGPGFRQVLTIHMAALAALDALRHGEEAPADPARISAYLLKRERAHWQQWHARAHDPLPTSPEVMSRAVYLGTLTGPLSHAQGIQVLARTQVASGPDKASQILTDHGKCYPPEDPAKVLEPLYPDRLGEDFIGLATPVPHADVTLGDLGAFADPWAVTSIPSLLGQVLDERPAAWLGPAMATLIETARRWPHVATGLLYPLILAQPRLALLAGGTAIASLAALPDVDMAVLEAVEACFPAHRHVDLDTGIAALTDRLARHHLAVSSDPALHASVYNLLGIHLSNAGLYEKALAATGDAIRIWRQLAGTDRDTALPNLARALNNHVLRLAEAGQREEAVPVAQEAVQLSRDLADVNRDIFLEDLAYALNNYALRLADVGRWGEAASVSEEAIGIVQELAGLDPSKYRQFLAATLSNHVVRLVETGRADEAVLASVEAVELSRKVAADDRSAYLPDLAMSLNNRTIALSTVGQRDEAIPAAQEAVQLYRELAEHNRTAYLAHLARMLVTYASLLSRAGPQDEAIMLSAEAVKLYRELAEHNRLAHLPGLARAVTVYADLLGKAGRQEEAIRLGEEAVGLSRELAKRDPGSTIPVGSLSSHTRQLMKEGRNAEALRFSQEALQLYRELAVRSRVANLPGLADTLADHARLLLKTGRGAEAVAPSAEAVQLYREATGIDRAAHLQGLANALDTYADGLRVTGQQEEAIHAFAEAVQVWRELSRVTRDAYLPGLAWALRSHAVLLGSTQRQGEAIQVSQEAVQLYGELAKLDRATHLPDLTIALANYAEFLSRAGEHDAALPLSQQAVELFGELAERNQAEYPPDLAAALHNHATHLAAAGRRDEAIQTCRKAIELRQTLVQLNQAAYLADYVESVAFFGYLRVEGGQPRAAILPLIAALTMTLEGIPDDHPKNRLGDIIGTLRRVHTTEPAELAAKFREYTGEDVPDIITRSSAKPVRDRTI